MAKFRAKLGTSAGEILFRDMEGRHAAEVTHHFTEQGYFVFSVKRALSWAPRRAISPKDFSVFNQEFLGLVRAGLPIVEGLHMVMKRMRPTPLKQVLERVSRRLNRGESLSQAFTGVHPSIPRYYPALLFAGEQSGNLGEVLSRFLQQQSRVRAARKRLRNALTYPFFLTLVGIVAMYVILGRAMPQFAAFYVDSGQDLPALTSFVIHGSQWVMTHANLIVGSAVGLTVGLVLVARTPKGTWWLERGLLRVPIFGRLWMQQNQNTFAWTMRMLLAGGLPVLESLGITADALSSAVFREQLVRAREAVRQGSSLEAALAQHVGFDPLASEMVRVGESSGTLVEMFEYLAQHGDEHMDDTLDMISTVVAPVVLLLVGLTIATMVVAMYLPIFGVTDLLGD